MSRDNVCSSIWQYNTLFGFKKRFGVIMNKFAIMFALFFTYNV